MFVKHLKTNLFKFQAPKDKFAPKFSSYFKDLKANQHLNFLRILSI